MILLINPGSRSIGLNEATVQPPLGLMYMATLLKQNGFPAKVYDAALKNSSPRNLLRLVALEKPDIIGLRVYYYNLDWSKEFIVEARKIKKDLVIGVGGPVASYDPIAAINSVGADFSVSGEGEFPLLVLAKNRSLGRPYYENVPGITAKHQDGGYYTGPENTRIKDLDSLPFPDYDLVGGPKVYSSKSRFNPSASIFTTRGCPFNCLFCTKDVFGNIVTFRSPENVIKEIKLLKTKYGVRQIDILDDNFAVNKPHLEKVLDLIISEKMGIFFDLKSGVRIEALDEAILKKMRQAGFYKISFGIESADEKVLQFCDKKLDLPRLKEIAILAKRMGFNTAGFFIIGLPGETRRSVTKTIKLAKEIKLDVANFCIATPYPGTGLYKYVKERGNFTFDPEGNYDFGFYGAKAFYSLPGLSEDEILERFKYAYKTFYNFDKISLNLINIRSLAELRWYIGAALSVFRGIVNNFRSNTKNLKAISLPRWLKLPQEWESQNINDPLDMELHAKILAKKKFLTRLYADFYKDFRKATGFSSAKSSVEIGSGCGFIKRIIPNVITSDILPLNNNDMCFRAEILPFRTSAIDAFYMMNVFHHLQEPHLALNEMNRCLKPGGKIVMIEPANTPLGRFIFRNFHHEPFDPAERWRAGDGKGPLPVNDARPWVMFSKCGGKFEEEFNFLKIKKIRCHTPLRYVISGGFSIRQLAPSFTYDLVRLMEIILSPLNRYLGIFMTIEIEKNPGIPKKCP